MACKYNIPVNIYLGKQFAGKCVLIVFSFFAAAVAVFEYGHFAFGAIYYTVDIVLVCEDNQQSNRNGKNTVQRNIVVENK